MKTKKCFHCGASAFRRVNRVGFLERTLLPWFGYFPWECAICRRKSYLRDDGHGNVSRQKPR